MTSFRFCLLLLWLTCHVVNNANGQQSVAKKSWPQYGHGSNWRSSLEFNPSNSIAREWSIEIGEGRSQVVGSEDEIYIASGTSKKEDNKTKLTTRIVAVDFTNGERKWSYEAESTMYDEQETFGGATAAPQATPAIAGTCLISISFTGQVTCLNRADGALVWKKDLVKDFDAEPVQFGFSASPVVDPAQPDRVYIIAAGERAGFYCLKVKDGAIIWKADCGTCSYATPVAAKFGEVSQWIIVTEDELLGVSADEGKRLWRFELAETGLTNVPTPIVFDETRLVISGQGSKGTRCLAITREADDWKVDEVWYARKLLLFYTNWLKLNDRVIVGCTDKYLAAIDVNDGSILGRWRGYGDGNILIADLNLLVLDGKGNLSVIEPRNSSSSELTGFVASGKFNVIDARCWAPLSIVANRILIRGDDQLVCLNVGKNKDSSAIENLLSTEKKLMFERELAQKQVSDPVEEIFSMFETKGQDAALSLYTKLRSEKALNEEARIALAASAQEQGLIDVAKMIIAHAAEDYPDSKEVQSAAKSILDK